MFASAGHAIVIDGMPHAVMSTPVGEGSSYAKDCYCALCENNRELIRAAYRDGTFAPFGPWCDPRRGYSESKEEFKARVPNGFTEWPEDHEKHPEKG